MKICIFTLVLLSRLVFTTGAASHYFQKKEKKIEDRMLSQIRALPEVKNFMKYAKKSTPMLMIAREPDSTFKYYWIKLGIGNFDIFRTSTNYYINPKTLRIYFLDMMDTSGGAIIPLRQWRRLRSDPRFYNLHTIKSGQIIPVTLKAYRNKNTKKLTGELN